MNYFKCNYTKSWFPLNHYNKDNSPVTLLHHNEAKNEYIGFSTIELPTDDNIELLTKDDVDKLLEKINNKKTKW